MRELIEIITHLLSNPLSMTSLLIIIIVSLIWTVHWMTKRFTKIDMTQQHFEQRLDMNVEAIKDVKTEIVRLSEKMDKRFDKVDERFDKVDERFAKVDERFAKVDERFDKIEARLNNMDKRFAKGDSNFARIEEKLSELNARQLRLEGKVDKLGDKVNNLNDKLDATREDVAGLKAVVGLHVRKYSIPVNVHKKSLKRSVL